MGLDGFVRCRCWKDGKVEPPARLAGLIVVGDDGELDLSVPYEGNAELYHAFDRWTYESACPHTDMTFAFEHVGNWHAYRGFQHALAEIGWQRFPVLRAVLPNGNGGTAEPSAATAALAELRGFAQHAAVGEQALLCDAETGEVISEQTHAFGGAISMIHQVTMGIDLNGFVIRRGGEDGAIELFRSTRFTQEVIQPGAESQRPTVRFTDGTQKVTVAVEPVGGQPHGAPRNLELRSRPYGPDSFALTIDALTWLFQASFQTNNPVVWC